ncbi:MAG: hypothetical protein AAF628_17355 [Planctomycetota bacterium]
MFTLGERGFHLLMGALVLGSTLMDRILLSALPAWDPPVVSLLTLAIGLVWVALFAAYRGRNLEERMRVLEDRLERAQRRVDAHDAELAERRRGLI